MDKATKQNGVIKVLTDAYTGRKSRVISALYKGLLKSRGNSTMHVKEKWERELGIEITKKEWYEWLSQSVFSSFPPLPLPLVFLQKPCTDPSAWTRTR